MTGRLEPQVVSFPLGWTTNPAGMKCMVALFQERVAWGNGSCRTLSLLFATINDCERLKPPWFIRPPSQSSNFASCLSRGRTRVSAKCIHSEGWSFEEMSNKSALTFARADMWRYLWWTFTWDSSGQMEWDLHSSPVAYPFHPGIVEMQTFPNQGKTEIRSCFPWGLFDSLVYIDTIGSHEESLMNSKQGTR
jgi:hypothetical protein